MPVQLQVSQNGVQLLVSSLIFDRLLSIPSIPIYDIRRCFQPCKRYMGPLIVPQLACMPLDVHGSLLGLTVLEVSACVVDQGQINGYGVSRWRVCSLSLNFQNCSHNSGKALLVLLPDDQWTCMSETWRTDMATAPSRAALLQVPGYVVHVNDPLQVLCPWQCVTTHTWATTPPLTAAVC